MSGQVDLSIDTTAASMLNVGSASVACAKVVQQKAISSIIEGSTTNESAWTSRRPRGRHRAGNREGS